MQYRDARPVQFKVILLGEAGVGKTSLFQRFRSRHIPSTPKSALMLDCYQYSRQFAVGPDSCPVQLDLWDTANMERVRSLTESYFRETAATLLVYDIADSVSLKRIPYWQQELSYHTPDSTTNKIFLIGNKSDLEALQYDCDHTTVSYAKEVIGKQCKDVISVFEVSAKEDCCVERMFHAVAEHLWQCHTAGARKGSKRSNPASDEDEKAQDSSFRLEDNQLDSSGTSGKGCC
ncbi:ras-related protein YPTC6-like [Acanthaster planci]|uniref:Ras-related protein YPTC6-like n=1 Tax=Acanthaster planci TaxID=133434 RepID=A0A8B7YHV1_ACAPL|nr:ras-related protein YPTC6-like [Acanthaster planci]XP_022091955.1 ras-related protein YPTC6-like [Acanthaster planci]XP_022091956.1 ras-related protein YPTC6-like [Acanthaster planci]XP_022091957.1 ras-related protein YPTC6-like [Acanthaster planci]XP_022091958.1 ras-related protein YPTC6-like [Acanthaster planci]XP_022091959.1 ras-related protein YPTC6-like [Acanthaster planci]XP_022091960.1 ras-related protein YPTC6-like [Acanthaster planci]XP_022091961.1 ras-related protein YPTC6-like 